MAFLYVKHRVKDFDVWYEIFKSHEEAQKDDGLVDLQLFRDQNDPNDIIVIFRIENMEKAKQFISAPASYEAKDESGVIGEPECLFLEKI